MDEPNYFGSQNEVRPLTKLEKGLRHQIGPDMVHPEFCFGLQEAKCHEQLA